MLCVGGDRNFNGERAGHHTAMMVSSKEETRCGDDCPVRHDQRHTEDQRSGGDPKTTLAHRTTVKQEAFCRWTEIGYQRSEEEPLAGLDVKVMRGDKIGRAHV